MSEQKRRFHLKICFSFDCKLVTSHSFLWTSLMESNIFVRTPTWVIPIYYEQNKKKWFDFLQIQTDGISIKDCKTKGKVVTAANQIKGNITKNPRYNTKTLTWINKLQLVFVLLMLFAVMMQLLEVNHRKKWSNTKTISDFPHLFKNQS